jgi:putative ABC transport system permease protein
MVKVVMGRTSQDISYGIRTLRDRPAFTLIAVLSLALGIGVNTTIFSIINATLLAPLGLENEDRLVALTTHPLEFPDNQGSAQYREYQGWRQDARSFEAVGALWPVAENLGGQGDGGAAEELIAIRCQPGLFEVLGIRPQIGRLITAEEDQVENWAPVALISDRFWERRFGRDPGVLGQTLRLDSVVTTIIGVMPPGIEEKIFLPEADLWVPSRTNRAQVISNAGFLQVVARLAPATTLEQARLELDTMARRFAEEYPASNANRGFGVVTLHEFFYGGAREPLLILQGAVLFVLLIACANVAGLLLARATARQTEIAIRSAVGAARGRLIRQVLTESVVLAVLGGIFGVLFAWGGLRVFVAAAPSGVPNLDSMTINLNVLAFVTLVVLVTAIAFGIFPALQGTRPDLTTLLNDASRGSSAGAARQRVRLALVAGQTGIAMILLITAGLLINSFLKLRSNDLGADPTGILTFQIRFAQDDTITFTGQQVDGVGLWDVNPRIGLVVEQMHAELKAIPGVSAASAASRLPFQGTPSRGFLIDGRETDEQGAQLNGAFLAVMPGYFEALKVDIQRGRPLDESDNAGARRVVVINEAMASRYWKDTDPIGSSITLKFVPNEPAREVVGVVSNVLLSQYADEATPAMYIPYGQQTDTWLGPQWQQRSSIYFVVKGRDDPMDLVPLVRSAVARVDSDLPLTDVRTVEQYLAQQMQGDVLWVSLLSIFGAIAGVLAVTGIYGVISYAVAQRTHEIGIRVALGASSRAIVMLIMRQAVIVVAAGLVVGIIGSLILTRLIANTLFGIEATDPLTFVVVSLLLLAAALVACIVPTRRALRVHPSEVLRYE